jgi:hypothetical protein
MSARRSYRATEDRLRRGFEVSRRYELAYARWQAERIVTTAELLGMSVGDVDIFDIVVCRARYGRPSAADTAPVFHSDRRYGRRC